MTKKILEKRKRKQILKKGERILKRGKEKEY